MGKKKNLSGHTSGTKAFADKIGQANLEALKPYIDQQIKIMMQKLAQQQLAAIGEVLGQFSALKTLLQEKGVFTKEEILEAQFLLEEAAMGQVQSTEPVSKGDFLRVIYTVKAPGTEEFGPEQRTNVRDYGENQEQFPKEFYEALDGMNKGDSKEVDFIPEGSQDKYSAKITVVRIAKVKSVKQNEPAAE